jgi:hypothetical protein
LVVQVDFDWVAHVCFVCVVVIRRKQLAST